jgi:hypothetical protein
LIIINGASFLVDKSVPMVRQTKEISKIGQRGRVVRAVAEDAVDIVAAAAVGRVAIQCLHFQTHDVTFKHMASLSNT